MKKPPLDPGLERFENRTGVSGFPGWRGVNSELDIEGMPDNQLFRLVNGRWQQGNLIPVAPKELFTTLDITQKIKRMYGYTLTSPIKLWTSNLGCPGPVGVTGSQVNNYDSEQSPNYQQYGLYKHTTDGTAVIGTYSGSIYIGFNSVLRRSHPLATPIGQTQSGLATSTDIVVKIFSGWAISTLLELDGKLFIGLTHLSNPTTLSKIVVLDGVTFTDDVTGINAPIASALWREHIVFSFSDQLRIRNVGDAPGTYSAVSGGSVPVGLTGVRGNTMVSWRDILYGVEGTDKIWSLNDAGTTVTNVRTVATAAASGGIPGTTSVGVFLDELVYLWNNGGTIAYIGKFNNSGDATTEWQDTYKSLTGDLATMLQATILKIYRDNILVGAGRDSVVHSPGRDIAGTWIGPGPVSTSTNFRILEMVIY